ncbi:hypothetical protein JTE90_017672 [Oedothorax gibbosus]|uniref:Uncharacterized protein n=1 Tax=Oedothorax gibbosus TaxID=931172 RepID=A0AAV6UFZ9_9ARAC|nr:hypothetical protein JTE90_017672 [Oedothorax gibbosus]
MSPLSRVTSLRFGLFFAGVECGKDIGFVLDSYASFGLFAIVLLGGCLPEDVNRERGGRSYINLALV